MGLKINFEDLIKKYDLTIEGIIHVGAHEGQEVNLYERIGVKNIMLFEPIPKIFDKLKAKYFKDYLVFDTALGNIEGNIMMNIENSNDCKSSSILEPLKHIDYYPHINPKQLLYMHLY
jgi:hypothetical protein